MAGIFVEASSGPFRKEERLARHRTAIESGSLSMTLDEIDVWLSDHRDEVVGALRACPDRLDELSGHVEPGDDPAYAFLCVIDALLGWPGLARDLPRGFNDFLRQGARIRPQDYSEELRRRVNVLNFVKNAIISARDGSGGEAGVREHAGADRPEAEGACPPKDLTA